MPRNYRWMNSKAIQIGMKEKAEEFKKTGAEIYR